MFLGRTHLIDHVIDTGDHRPVTEPLRRHAKTHLGIIDAAVDAMLQSGIVERAASPWSSNVVVCTKKDGTPRITIDYRKLNNITYRDRWPLTRISDCFDTMSGSVYFGALDISNSFFQIPISDLVSRDKTAFITHRGQFRFCVLPQGAVNSPSVFSRLMSLVMTGLSWESCLIYIDDVLILGSDIDNAYVNTEKVLDRFRQANLKLKPTKTRLFQLKIGFLCHVISAAGL